MPYSPSTPGEKRKYSHYTSLKQLNNIISQRGLLSNAVYVNLDTVFTHVLDKSYKPKMHYWVTVFTERFPNKGKLFSDLLKSLACTTHNVKFLEQYSTIFPPSDVL